MKKFCAIIHFSLTKPYILIHFDTYTQSKDKVIFFHVASDYILIKSISLEKKLLKTLGTRMPEDNAQQSQQV